MDQSHPTITRDMLIPLVRKAVSNPTAEIESWQIEKVSRGWGGAQGGTAVYRLSGMTRGDFPWSLILKILYERPGETEEAPYYWKREYEVYRSGLIEKLPDSGLFPPDLYHTEALPGSCWIWLEDIREYKHTWTLDDYGEVSRRIGRFNGEYLAGRSMPDAPWLNFNWHSRIIPPLTKTFTKLSEYLTNTLIQRALPARELETITSIWETVSRYQEVLVHLPQTLCHLDAFRRNIFIREDDIKLIDWAVVGRGAVGEDLTAMVAVSLYFGEVPISKADDLDTAVFDGYLAGLQETGWQGNPRVVRLGYTCAMTLRGLAGVKQDIDLLMDKNSLPNLVQLIGLEEIGAIADHFAAVRRFRLVRMAEEARGLMVELG